MAEAPATVVRAAAVVTPTGVLSPGEVVVDHGVIVEIRAPTGGGPMHNEVAVGVLVPGFVDLQMNGIGAVDVAEADGDDWDVLDAALLAQGVTTWCPTVCSAPVDRMESSLGRIDGARIRPGPARPTMAGAHLEGPFLAVAGAHRPEHLPGTVDRAWLAGLGADVAVVTLAPELPGAMAAVEALAAAGVLVALGHSACTFEEAGRAADAGARLVTHLGNAMGPFRPREPGLLGAALVDDRLAVSIIADLVHVHAALVRLAFRAKGPGGVVLVTDAVATDVGTTTAAGPPAGDEPPRMVDGTLVGSVLRMDRALAHAVGPAGVGLAEAVAAASTTPSSLLGLADRGAIAVGRRADLVALHSDLRVETVWIAGEKVWTAGTRGPTADN